MTPESVALVPGASSIVGKVAPALGDAGFSVLGASRDASRLTAPGGIAASGGDSVHALVGHPVDPLGAELLEQAVTNPLANLGSRRPDATPTDVSRL